MKSTLAIIIVALGLIIVIAAFLRRSGIRRSLEYGLLATAIGLTIFGVGWIVFWDSFQWAAGPVEPLRPVGDTRPSGYTGSDPNDIVSCRALRGERVSRADCRRLDDINASLQSGSGAVDHPESMLRGETATISFVVSADPKSTPVSDLLGSAPEKEVKLKIGRRMAAQLTGDGFKIEPTELVERDLYVGPAARWEWRVTALNSPSHRLLLSAYVIVEASDGKKEMLLRTLELPLAVKVTWGQRFDDFMDATEGRLKRATAWVQLLIGLIAVLGTLATVLGLKKLLRYLRSKRAPVQD